MPWDRAWAPADTLKTFSQDFEITNIIGFVFGYVHGNISVGHFPQNPADIIDGFSETVAYMMNCLGNHANFVCPANERLQLLAGGQFQVAKTADGMFHNH